MSKLWVFSRPTVLTLADVFIRLVTARIGETWVPNTVFRGFRQLLTSGVILYVCLGANESLRLHEHHSPAPWNYRTGR